MRFESLSELSVSFLTAQGIKGVIFDLDDTLVPEHTGVLREDVAQMLKAFDQAGIRLAIISNNHLESYCARIIEQLRQLDISCLFLGNGYKPMPFSFYHVESYFNLPFNQMLLVGDGVFTDHLAAKMLKMHFGKTAWFPRPFYKCGIFWWVRELIVLAVDFIRFAMLGHRTRMSVIDPADNELTASDRLEKRRYLFLVNPKSGKSNLDELNALIQEIFESVPYQQKTYFIKHVSKIQSHLGQKVKAGLYTHVIAIGGDGTVREAVQLIAANNPKVCLGIVSTGTGNLVAKSLHLPLDLSGALNAVVYGRPVPFSIMKVNRHYAALAAGMGVDAEIMAETDSSAKKLLGPLAYVISGIKVSLFKRKTWFRLNIDGRKMTRKADGVFVIQRNQYAQAYFPMPLNYSEDENMLDICIVSAENHLDVLLLLQKLFSADYEDPEGRMEHYRCKRVQITGWPKSKVQIDGDLVKDTTIDAQVLEGCLNVMIPG